MVNSMHVDMELPCKMNFKNDYVAGIEMLCRSNWKSQIFNITCQNDRLMHMKNDT